MHYLKVGGTWLLQLALAVLMAGPGMSKFTSANWERMFRRWGYPDGFYLVVGAIEVIAGAGLLIPRFTSYCAMLLSGVMLAAAVTHIRSGTRNGIAEIALAMLLAMLAWIRWRGRMRLAALVAAVRT